jgi:hypothetical protein
MKVKTFLALAVYREAAELPRVGVCGTLLPRRRSSAPQRTTDAAQLVCEPQLDEVKRNMNMNMVYDEQPEI